MGEEVWTYAVSGGFKGLSKDCWVLEDRGDTVVIEYGSYADRATIKRNEIILPVGGLESGAERSSRMLCKESKVKRLLRSILQATFG